MNYECYTGGYTTPLPTGNGVYIGKANGITRLVWSPEMGVISRQDFSGIINPSFLLRHPTKPVLYCVNETEQGGVQSFCISEKGRLSLAV